MNNNIEIETVKSFKLLGMWITADLTWNLHVDKITLKASKRLYVLRILRWTGLNQSYLQYVLFIALS
jgi:hypothetical protein